MPVPERLAQVAPSGDAGAPALHATPDGRKLKLRVGETQRFAADAPADSRPRWTLDGDPVDATAEWTFAPTAAQVGSHVVSLTSTAGKQTWLVRVIPPHLPRVAAAIPAGDTVSAEVDRPVSLRFDVRPSAPGETVTIAWTVDGMPAGEGDTLRWSWNEPVNARARAVATSSLGSAVGREWRILVRARGDDDHHHDDEHVTARGAGREESVRRIGASEGARGDGSRRVHATAAVARGARAAGRGSLAPTADRAGRGHADVDRATATTTTSTTTAAPPATSTTASAADRPADDSARAAARRDGSGHRGRGAPAARPLCRGVEESRRR